MVKEIYYSPYKLASTYPLNATSEIVIREGSLLKVKYDCGKIGYSDCHPWPELGDLSIRQQLANLAQGVQTPLTRCALEFSRLDAESRSIGKSAFPPCIKYSQSHFLLNNLISCSSKHVLDLLEQGYTHIKIKVGRNIEREIDHLHALFLETPFKLRLDFNATALPQTFRAFLSRIVRLKKQVDFIEDPYPYDYEQWKSIQDEGWILACDREAARAAHQPEAARILIIKPAIHPFDEWRQWKEQTKVVTSYLGHPLGQVAAAYVAHEIDPTSSFVHGLSSHQVYLPNSFSLKLNWQSPFFINPPGSGFGFDEELNALEWIPLNL